ncbi:glycosyltransferase [Lagierella sp.]|uniref:glycosyltransferase n=1 Tax=Lagierella sp. TaxID=2849657 RepID=UPI00262F0551|nr:glycosyltransferase [Lagierella sp.]
MKILISTDAYAAITNGVVTSVKNLRQELLKLGHDVKILTLSPSTESYIDREENIIYLGSFDISILYPDARFTLAWKSPLIDEILEWHPDIIHSQSEFTTFHIARIIKKKLHIPHVHTYHTLYEDYTHYFSKSETIGKMLVEKFTKTISDKTTAFIVPTIKTKNIIQDYGLTKPIHIVPTGLEEEKFEKVYTSEETDALREKIGIPIENKVLLFVGRVGKEKNIGEILEYLNRIKRKDISFVIVGDGPEKRELEEYTKSSGMDYVIFTGLVDNEKINIYYQMADLFVSASTSETQGLTYVEALFNGLPVLCRDDICLKEPILQCKTGFRYRKFEEFKEQLNEFLDNKDILEEMSKNCREHAIKTCSAKAFANNILDVYKKYVKGVF